MENDNTDTKDIAGRLETRLSGKARLVFWEDPEGAFRDAVNEISLDGAELIDATHAELAAKRAVVEAGGRGRFVIYRSGPTPPPGDDLLLDLKLAAAPFACTSEGLWADECGIEPALADCLTAHRAFFRSKERRQRLRDSKLPKDTAGGVRLTMLAACAGTSADEPRDAVRDTVSRLVVERARGGDRTMRLVAECGLEAELWDQARLYLGYEVGPGERPGIDDLAYRMLLTLCAPALPEAATAGRALAPDATRIMRGIAESAQTRDAYDAITSKWGGRIAKLVPADMRNAESVGVADALPEFDQWALASLADDASRHALTSAHAEEVATRRAHSLWAGRFRPHYECLRASAALREQLGAYKASAPSHAGIAGLFRAYASDWWRVDASYRAFTSAWKRIGTGQFRQSTQRLRDEAESSYEWFLSDLADRWQTHLLDEGGAWPPASVPSQRSFFRTEVLAESPEASRGHRVGVIVSDALRYEVGQELARSINASTGRSLKGATATCAAAASMLPSYTQLGMAALLPEGELAVSAKDKTVTLAGQPTAGTANRQKLLAAALPGSVAVAAADVLEDGLPDLSGAPVVYVYHNAIDRRGDSRATEGEAFAACRDALDELGRLCGALLAAGCRKVLVTADHGFIYQDGDLADHQFADVEGIHDLEASGVPAKASSRFLVTEAAIADASLDTYDAAQLSLAGDCHVSLPRGTTRLRRQGSGSRFVHGGATPQECVVPVVAVTRAKSGPRSHATGVQVFTGRKTITGSFVAVTLYQEEPCSDLVSPATVKVGLYAPGPGGRALCAQERVVELSSPSSDTEERKVPVTLELTDDVDDHAAAVLRVSRRVGTTNQYATEIEVEYRVSRAFGSDFDF